MYVTNWIEQNTMMGMLLELIDNYNIPILNSSQIFLLQFSVTNKWHKTIFSKQFASKLNKVKWKYAQ